MTAHNIEITALLMVGLCEVVIIAVLIVKIVQFRRQGGKQNMSQNRSGTE